jgi:hypothetical protein
VDYTRTAAVPPSPIGGGDVQAPLSASGGADAPPRANGAGGRGDAASGRDVALARDGKPEHASLTAVSPFLFLNRQGRLMGTVVAMKRGVAR